MEEQQRREATRRQMEEQRARMQEQQRKQQEELRLKREAEMKARQEMLQKQREAEEKRKQEQKSLLGIRRVIQEVRMATIESFEPAQQKLNEIMASDLGNCGTQAQTIKEECDRIVEQAKTRVDALIEVKKKEQEKKEAEEKKRKEQEEKAQAFIKDLTELVETAETSSKKLEEDAAPFELDKKEEERTKLESAKVKEVASAIEASATDAKAAANACTQYILDKGPDMKDAMAFTPTPLGAGAVQSTVNAEVKKSLAELLQRINVCGKKADSLLKEAKDKKEEAARFAVAKKKNEEIDAIFKKYDKDKDEALSQAEATAYAKSELKFPVDKAGMEKIWRCAVEPGAKGICKDNFHLLNTSVGIAKELQRDKKRKAAREAKEKYISGLQDKLAEKVAGVAKNVTGLEAKIAEVEKAVAPLLSKVKATPVSDMVKEADACDKLIKSVVGKVSEVNQKVIAIPQGFDKKYEDDLKAAIRDQTKPLELRMKRSDMRLTRATNLSSCYREKAARKTADSVREVRDFALKLARQHAKLNSLTIDELFSKINSKGDGKLDKVQFQAFFDSIDHEIKEEAEKVAEKPAEAEATEGSAEKSEEKPAEATESSAEKPAEASAEPEKKEPEQKEPEKKEPEKKVPKVDLTPEALSSLFSSLLEAKSKTLSQDVFRRFMKVYFKVVQDTPLTKEIEIAGSEAVRQVKANEVLEPLGEPQEETTAKVMRVKVKALSDGAEGWATLTSNQKKPMLEEVGPFFKTLISASLTDSFEDATPKESVPKLNEGVVLEVLEWPKKHEESELTRMQVKVRVTGAVGWLTQKTKEGVTLADIL